MDFRYHNKLDSYNLKNIIGALRDKKIEYIDIKRKLKKIIDHYHLRTLRTNRCYNLFDFVHDLYELGEYDLINDIIQTDYDFSEHGNLYDSLLAFDLYKDKTSYIYPYRLRLLLSFHPKNYNWNIFYKEFEYNVSESEYDDYIPEIYTIVKESNITEVAQYIIKYWNANKDFLFEDNLTKFEYIDEIIND